MIMLPCEETFHLADKARYGDSQLINEQYLSWSRRCVNRSWSLVSTPGLLGGLAIETTSAAWDATGNEMLVKKSLVNHEANLVK